MYGQAFSSPAAVPHMNHFLPFGRKNLADAFAKSIFPCNLMVLLLKGGMTKIESERSAAWFSAFDWGSKGREFESLYPDQFFCFAFWPISRLARSVARSSTSVHSLAPSGRKTRPMLKLLRKRAESRLASDSVQRPHVFAKVSNPEVNAGATARRS